MRSKMKNILMAAGILCLFGTVGCKKGYLDINTNPNNPAGVTPELVLPSALNGTASRLVTGSIYPALSNWVGMWAVSGSYAPSTTNFSTYKETTDFGGGVWADIYNNLEDYYYVETQSTAQSKPFYAGAAKIMIAHEFQQLVDMFGNIPYINSLQGVANLQPAYDDAQAIYEDLINQIDTGITLLKSSTAELVLPSTDIMFNGDITSWVQFANTLKLRILIRQSEISGRAGYIQTQINNINSEGSGFLTTDAGVNPGYINTAGKQNPYFGFNYNSSNTYINDFWRAGKYGVDFYFKNHDSARGELVYAVTPSSLTANQNYFASDDYNNLTSDEKALVPADTLLQWVGNIVGQTDGAVGSGSSAFGPPTPTVGYGPNQSVSYSTKVSSDVSQPAIIISAAESYFLQAEAALRGWLDEDAESLYHAGIQASFDYLGAGDATDYYSQTNNSNVFWNDSKGFAYNLNLIIAQKWAAENGVTPFEAWCDYRRLPNLPFNKAIPLTRSPYVDVLAVPVRILYPTSEYASNGANVPSQGQEAHHTDKIFWMP
jgi:hypothetical protein